MNIRQWLLAILSGLVFVAFLAAFLNGIDPDWYVARDDAVITMSAARNLVDFGFIGVNPSGPIVEASSAPVQLFAYAAAYAVAHLDYFSYSVLQTYVCYFLIGVLFFLFFRNRPVLALGLCLLAAWCLTFFPSFIEWHASGMENAITNAALLFSTYLLYRMFVAVRINYFYAIPLFFAAMSRIEGIYHVAPLLLIFAVAWRLRFGDHRGTKLLGLTLLVWCAGMAARYAYFQDLLPNTAYAQDISLGARFRALLSFDMGYFAQSYGFARFIFLQLGLWIVFLALVLLILARKSAAIWLLTALCLSLLLTAMLNPFVFGPTRIDLARTASYAPLFLMLLIASGIYFSPAPWRALAACFVVAMPVGLVYQRAVSPYKLGWSTNRFNEVRETFLAMARANGIDRPTTANPDLGAMTWYKQLNDVDLGLIGSPVVARLADRPALTDYIVNYAEPDFIEAHADWVWRYCRSFILDPGFAAKYAQYDSSYDIEQVCRMAPEQIPTIFWWRRDILRGSRSPERQFLEAMQADLSLPRVADEIAACAARHTGDPAACSYIARTVYRFIPKLRRDGRFDAVYRLFSHPPDKALLIGWRDPKAYLDIIRSVQDDSRRAEGASLAP